jgi:malonyl-CoA O-methyltransferase
MISKQAARRAFSKAAPTYDDNAVLQREIALRMLERLDYIRLRPTVILDAGAGTGEASAALAKRYPKAKVIALDFALPMLQQARRRGRFMRRPVTLCADLEQLPLAAGSVDMIYSNVAIQWCADLESTFRDFLRVLKPGGLLMFSTFGPDTLKELREAWSQVDDRPHVSPFLDMHDIGDMLMQSRFAEPVMDAELINMTYGDVQQLMRDIKAIGAHNALRERHRGLTGKARMQRFMQAYEQFRTQGRLPSTWEVVYGHAWAPEQLSEGGVTRIAVESLSRKPPAQAK